MARWILIWCCVGLTGVDRALGAGPPPSNAYLARLISDLGDDEFSVREKASLRLAGWRGAADLLENARLAPEAEIRQRAKSLLREIDQQRAPARCRRMASLVMDGRIDLLPDHMLRWGEYDEEDDISLKAAARFGALLLSRAHRRLETPFKPRPTWGAGPTRGSAWQWAKQSRHAERVVGGEIERDANTCLFAAGSSIRVRTGNGLYVSAGDIEAVGNSTSCAILIANGDVKLGKHVSNCIIVSDGKVVAGRYSKCVIVAREEIDQTGFGLGHSVFACCGDITLTKYLTQSSIVEQHHKCPLRAVRFFDVADVGLSLDGLKIKSATGPLAALRKGDAFVSVDGVAVKDADGLRRALRKRFAIGGVGTFVVRRDGKETKLRACLE